MERPAAERGHLEGFDAAKTPRFRWRDEPIPDRPRVLIQTPLGDIEVELEATKAPKTVENFLHYVHEGFYGDGSFFRTVTVDNQPGDAVKIAVIQAQANPAKEKEFLPPIRLERTSETGLRHLDGTLSMARSEPDSAQDSFSICVGISRSWISGASATRTGRVLRRSGGWSRGWRSCGRSTHRRPTDNT